MGCKNGDLPEQRSVSLSDALLLTTMCIVGLPVEVHVKDGSIYSGIFHTASVERDYGVVLKRARMIRMGKAVANLPNCDLIDTLVVLSGDLVQVVAKGVLLPVGGTVSTIADDKEEAVTGTICPLLRQDTVKIVSEKLVAETDHITHTRSPDQIEICSSHSFTGSDLSDNYPAEVLKGLEGKNVVPKSHGSAFEYWNAECINLAEGEKASSIPLTEGQIKEDKSQGQKDGFEQAGACKEESSILEVQCSSSSVDTCVSQPESIEEMHLKITCKKVNEACSDSSIPSPMSDTQNCGRHTSEEVPSSNTVSSVSASKAIHITLQPSCPSSSASQSGMANPQKLFSSNSTKEFKLNPGAKTFSPSFPSPVSTMPPALPAVASMGYIPNSSSAVPVASVQPEAVLSPFAPRSSLPLKIVQYDNSAGGNGYNSQYSPHIVGHVGNRLQPIRYASQYHPVQSGPAYMHPNSQPVMVGRLGQVVYVHPVSHDGARSAGVLSQVSACPLMTPHQAHLPKHQGSAAAQALQLCVAPPFMAGAQQPSAVPNHNQQLHYPSIRPIVVPGINGPYGGKFM